MADAWTKDPQAIVDVEFDVSDSISTGDTIASATVTVDDAGVDVSAWLCSGSATISGTSVYQRFRGGVPGATYKATALITTANGERFPHHLDITVTDDYAGASGAGAVEWTYTLLDATDAPIAATQVLPTSGWSGGMKAGLIN